MLSFFTEFSAAQKLVSTKFDVIFFAESRFYFQYFKHLFDGLTVLPNIRIAYITSDKQDEVLKDNRVQSFYLKTTLAGVFPRLQADVMIMTMPDLQNFIFKKSPSVKKYVYVFHALVSTHQQYRLHAFDHYDAIFCTGPQQEAEIRATEKFYGLLPKDIVRYGYPLLEELKEKKTRTPVLQKKVLIAPTWYEEGILNNCILPMLAGLTLSTYWIWLRPHPEFIKRKKKLYQKIQDMYDVVDRVQTDSSPSVFTHLLDAQFLITDRSGIALEYSFATRRPVLFIDTPLKIQNPEWERLRIEPLENHYRKMLGMSILPEEVNSIDKGLQALENRVQEFSATIQKAEAEVVFPSDHWQNGMAYVKENLSRF